MTFRNLAPAILSVITLVSYLPAAFAQDEVSSGQQQQERTPQSTKKKGKHKRKGHKAGRHHKHGA